MIYASQIPSIPVNIKFGQIILIFDQGYGSAEWRSEWIWFWGQICQKILMINAINLENEI